MRGYEGAKREGDKIGLDIYFGFEYGLGGNDFLIYNFGGDKILAYPEIMTDSFEKVAERIHGEGGFIIHAHPFREEIYITQPGRVFPEFTDAVEIFNTNQLSGVNLKAREYADKYKLLKTGGSDSHTVNAYANGLKGGVAFAQKPESLEDIISLIKQDKHVVLGGQ
jgi:predicted metal-dependent phosphoesterase TrpH